MTYRIESLLAAKLYVAPEAANGRVYFYSDLGGKLSLYSMPANGLAPGEQPTLLTPPDLALPNPHHLEGSVALKPLPALGGVLIMLDHNGDENYQPSLVPFEGGAPIPIFGDHFAGQQVICAHVDEDTLDALLIVDPRNAAIYNVFRVNLGTRVIRELWSTPYVGGIGGWNKQLTDMVHADSYTMGDVVLYHYREEAGSHVLLGTPINERVEGEPVILSGIGNIERTQDNAILVTTSLFEDTFSLGYLRLDGDGTILPVSITGTRHQGLGEMTGLKRIEDSPFRNRFVVSYNIDGVSWLYEGTLDEERLIFGVERILCGEGILADGVLEAWSHDRQSDAYFCSFSTATRPSHIYRIDHGALLDESIVRQLTPDNIEGIPAGALSSGEDASYVSFDGTRISARLYLPAMDLGHPAPYPVIFYIHGGPQSQERPDATWFSMPLIQFFTLNGFAVWVPNVRGSSGYGLSYMKQVDRDWGGKDRQDHLAAFELLCEDPRLDMSRAGIMGRSYGGYMTLRMITKHPALFKAACDMFGPYNLLTFIDRIPPSWKTYFHMAVGDPEKDREMLIEQSPSTFFDQISCPLLVIQGANDPRVVEQESADVVERLRQQRKHVEYLVFEDEGHDVIRYENKVRCYNTIVDFFRTHLMPPVGTLG